MRDKGAMGLELTSGFEESPLWPTFIEPFPWSSGPTDRPTELETKDEFSAAFAKSLRNIVAAPTSWPTILLLLMGFRVLVFIGPPVSTELSIRELFI